MGKMNLGRCKGLIRGTRVDAAVILLAGLLPLFWFRGSLIAGMDLPWPLSSPSYLVRSAASTWNPALCLGTADVSFRSALYFVISLGLHKLGFSLLATEKFWFVFWFAGAGLSMYFLIRALVPGNRLAALGGALFYMFNPYVMVVRLYELNLWLFFYALAPAVLALFATSIRTGRKLHVAGFLLASLLNNFLSFIRPRPYPSFRSRLSHLEAAATKIYAILKWYWDTKKTPKVIPSEKVPLHMISLSERKQREPTQ